MDYNLSRESRPRFFLNVVIVLCMNYNLVSSISSSFRCLQIWKLVSNALDVLYEHQIISLKRCSRFFQPDFLRIKVTEKLLVVWNRKILSFLLCIPIFNKSSNNLYLCNAFVLIYTHRIYWQTVAGSTCNTLYVHIMMFTLKHFPQGVILAILGRYCLSGGNGLVRSR